MEKTSVFQYENFPMTFETSNGKIMVNATEMAKPFGKQPYEFLRLPYTLKFIDALEATGKSRSLLINQINGVGTWMHEDVALEFARWLSPAFAIWCNDRIKELLKYGFTATPATIDELVANPDLLIKLATELKEERAQKEILANKLELQAPKVEVYEQIANSDSLLSFNDAAKALGVGRNKMMNDLRTRKILRANNTPYQDYINSGYFEVKVKNIRFGTGDKNYTQTFVTGKGLTWLGKILKSNK